MPKVSKTARADARGVVHIQVTLHDGDGARVKGNRTATIKVGAATVSEVLAAIAPAFAKPDVLRLKQ